MKSFWKNKIPSDLLPYQSLTNSDVLFDEPSYLHGLVGLDPAKRAHLNNFRI